MYSLIDSAEKVQDYNRYFEQFDYGCLALYDMNSDEWLRHNPHLSAKPLSPASTFKIFHSLIALEAGVAEGGFTTIKWDGQEYWNSNWNRDHTLRSAMRHSVVWYFQDIALMIGSEQMQRYLDEIGYGNRDISGGIESFWLGSSLQISADQQVKLLVRLMNDDLPFTSEHIALVKELISEAHDGYPMLFGKTGTAVLDNGIRVGWYVGFIEKEDKRCAFALNILGRNGISGQVARQTMLKILIDGNYLP